MQPGICRALASDRYPASSSNHRDRWERGCNPFSRRGLFSLSSQTEVMVLGRKQRVVCLAKRVHRSSDDEVDETDISLSTELRQRADPKYLSNVAKHLNVVWNASSRKKQKPESCVCCGGTGDSCCSFCRGTGALTLGKERFCSLEGGCKPCPVCNAKGAVKCTHCMGTGFRAAWMESPTCPASWSE